MTLFSQKLTVLLVLGALVVLVGIPAGLYQLSRGGTDGIVGAYLLVSVLIALLLIGLDRLSLRFVEARTLSVIELALVLTIGLWYAYANRTTTLDLSGHASPYFAVVWTSEASLAEKPVYRFPFDNVIRVTDKPFVCLDQREFDRLNVILPTSWRGSSRSKGFSLSHPHYQSVYVYQPETDTLLATQAEEIKQQVLNQLLHE